MEHTTWYGKWKEIRDPEYQLRLATELRREIENNPKHALFNQDVTFVAAWDGAREKDFVVYASEKGVYATIHLTYSVEHDPSWPWCTVIGDHSKLVEFIEREFREGGND